VTGTKVRFTYRELRDAVARFAGALAALGVGRGDRVVAYMKMVPEAFDRDARPRPARRDPFGGFVANELASRIADAKPKVVVSASCGIEPGRVISPGKGGLGTFASALDDAGNSVKGQLDARLLSRSIGLNLFVSRAAG
jgi:acyl-coenzyme A synthetase/AMP-(fatty) acid ligase